MSLDANDSLVVDDTESTLYQTIAVKYQKAINSLAVDCTGQYAALGGKKGIYIIDLEEPWETSKTLYQKGKWEISVAQWNPHPSKASWIASGAGNDLLIWNLEDRRSALQGIVQAHQRAVADINWSVFEPNILASCSADTYINVWDVRDTKSCLKMRSFCAWTVGASQVRWNRYNPSLLASAHDGEVRIWDIRREAAPMVTITAHMSKITGIDWSYQSEHELLSCSQDKTVKFWNIRTPNVCQQTLQTGTPVARARYTPFGKGVITMAQRSDFTLRLWALKDLSAPVHCFMGHTDIVQAFDWRAVDRQEGDLFHQRDYQLITWAKDLHLRLWSIEPEVLDEMDDNPSNTPRSTSASGTAHMKQNAFNLLDDPNLITNFEQEVTYLEQKQIPNITIEDVNLATRVVTVLIRVDMRIVQLRVVFPSHYPNGAAPSFEFLNLTSLTHRDKTKLKEILSETANHYCERNRPCFEACLRQAAVALKSGEIGSGLESDGLPRSSPTPLSLNSGGGTLEGPLMPDFTSAISPAPPPRTATPATTVDSSDMHVPYPRTCSAVWSGTSKLVVWFNRTAVLGKTMADYKRKFGSAPEATRDNKPRDVISIAKYFFGTGDNDLLAGDHLMSDNVHDHVDMDYFGPSMSGLRGQSSLSSLNAAKSSRDQLALVSVRDMSAYMPLSEHLGIHYTVNFDKQLPAHLSRREQLCHICALNAQAAHKVGREDLVQTWNLLSHVIDPKVYKTPNTSRDRAMMVMQNSAATLPWPLHPFGRHLVLNIVRHYEQMRDVQTLAMISCVLELAFTHLAASVESPAAPESEPAQPSRVSATNTPTVKMSSTTSSLIADYFSFFTQKQPSPKPKSHSINNNNNSTNTTNTTNTAPPSQYNSMSQLPEVSKLSPSPRVPSKSSWSLLEPSNTSAYHQYRKMYADVLYRWGLLNARASVLKYVEEASETHQGIDFDILCRHCGRAVSSPNCPHCKKSAMTCALCHLPVKGLSSFCLTCGHGGHSHHMQDWFRTETLCPSGCGCACKENNMALGTEDDF